MPQSRRTHPAKTDSPIPKVTLEAGSIQTAKADAIAVSLFKGAKKLEGATATVDRALGGAIAALLKLGDFQGKSKEASFLLTHGKLPSPRVLLVGLGERKGFNEERVREVSARAAVAARDRGCARLATVLHGVGVGGLDADRAARALVEGALLGLYQYREYKSKPRGEDEEPEKELKELVLVDRDASRIQRIRAAVDETVDLARITNDVRTLVNRPSADKTPPALSRIALAWAKSFGLKATQFDAPKLKALKMGGLLGVGQGSVHAPRLVILEKPGAGPKAKTVVLVGKGITFDTGGISIKPAQGMDAMRHDMAGAAAVLGAVCAAARLRVPHRVVGLLPIAENMPSGSAIRPGDILRAFDGSTMEVLNTDAEGRLILADALAYGVKTYAPDALIDLATLTGSIKVALGSITTGILGSDPGLVKRLIASGHRVGDDLWQLPLNAEYERHVKSDVADVKNTGTNFGGSITAAAFLKHFVGTTKWAHLDIAGTCWTDKSPGELRQEYHAKGATGIGVRLLAEFLRTWK